MAERPPILDRSANTLLWVSIALSCIAMLVAVPHPDRVTECVTAVS